MFFDLPVVVLVVSVMGAGNFQAEVNRRLEEGWGPARDQSMQVDCNTTNTLHREDNRCRYSIMMARIKEEQ